LSKKPAANVLTQCCTSVFTSASLLNLSAAKHLFKWNVLIHLVKKFGGDYGRAATSIIIVDIRPRFTEHPTSSSHHSITHSIFSINFTNLPINLGRAKIFGI
jgi:hypothetical protein